MSKELSVRYLMEVGSRRKWLLIVPLILCLLGAVLLVRTLPRFYRSTSTILVHPSELSRDFVRMVEYDVRRDLQNIEEQIHSRNWMERVVGDLDWPGKLEGQALDGLVGQMLNRVRVHVHGRTSFSISFEGKDPQLVFDVVDRLTQIFIGENVAQAARADADAATDLEEEIKTVEAELSTKEAELAVYKQRHMGELPEQIEPNQRMLERLQVQQQMNGENLRDARNRQLILESQLRGLDGSGQAVGDPLLNDLLEARQSLVDLKQRFTDSHPDVINAQARVEILEKQLADRAQSGGRVGDEDTTLPPVNTYGLALNTELDNVKMTINRLESEEVRLRQQITDIESRVNAAFNRQQELTQLTRDYENLEEYYRTLLDTQLNTRFSSRVLRTHSANRYEVIDPARVPRHPFKPDPIRIILMGIGLGFGIGVLLAAGLEIQNDAFFSAETLEGSTKIPVLATIPVLEDVSLVRQRKRRLAVVIFAISLVAVALVLVNFLMVDMVSLLRNFLNSVIQ